MTWRELAAKVKRRIGLSPTPYFSRLTLHRAQGIVAQAQAKARDMENGKPVESPGANVSANATRRTR